MDIIKKINELRLKYGWSVNNLAMEAGLTQSTLNSMLTRNTPPKIDTLQAICTAFNITLSQFFSDIEQDSSLTDTEKELLFKFKKLNKSKQKALLNLLE